MPLHERSVAKGDKVTLVRLSGEGLIRGVVSMHTPAGRIAVNIGGTSIVYYVAYADDGIRWTRGHHRDGTPAANGLLAAYGLSLCRL